MKNLEVLKNNLTNNNQQRILPPPEIFKSIRDHSMFLPIDVDSNGNQLFKLKNRNSPQNKILSRIKGTNIFSK